MSNDSLLAGNACKHTRPGQRIKDLLTLCRKRAKSHERKFVDLEPSSALAGEKRSKFRLGFRVYKAVEKKNSEFFRKDLISSAHQSNVLPPEVLKTLVSYNWQFHENDGKPQGTFGFYSFGKQTKERHWRHIICDCLLKSWYILQSDKCGPLVAVTLRITQRFPPLREK